MLGALSPVLFWLAVLVSCALAGASRAAEHHYGSGIPRAAPAGLGSSLPQGDVGSCTSTLCFGAPRSTRKDTCPPLLPQEEQLLPVEGGRALESLQRCGVSLSGVLSNAAVVPVSPAPGGPAPAGLGLPDESSFHPRESGTETGCWASPARMSESGFVKKPTKKGISPRNRPI